MNELLRYEEVIKEQLSDLALPGENFAWAEMKKLLDEDEERRPILLPWRPGCGPVVLLLVLLTGLAWYFLHNGKWFTNHSEEISKTAQTIQQDSIKRQKDHPSATYDSTNTLSTNDTTAIVDLPVEKSPSGRNDNLINRTDTLFNPYETVKNRKTPSNRNQENLRKKEMREKELSRNDQKKNTAQLRRRPGIASGKPSATGGRDTNKNNDAETNAKPQGNLVSQPAIPSADTPIKPLTHQPVDTFTDSLPVKKSVAVSKRDSTEKKDSAKTIPEKLSNYSWGAGLGLNQQIPFDGQKAVPYNSLGRKASLADYIPSAYFRFYKDNKWFVQAELRYGAPQYTKNITYSTEKNPTGNLETNLTLKKTYYHQLPVGFNYYVLPGLSVGSGLVWNKFSSAVSEQKVQRTSIAGQPDSVVSRSIVKTRSSANKVFSKSFLQWMGEFQYTYKKKYTLGARYAMGLQPYIKFQLPNEPLKEEKNSSLQVFFKYEFWNKKKKPKR